MMKPAPSPIKPAVLITADEPSKPATGSADRVKHEGKTKTSGVGNSSLASATKICKE